MAKIPLGRPTLKSLALSNREGGILPRPSLFEVMGPRAGDVSLEPSLMGLNQLLFVNQAPQLNGLIEDESNSAVVNNAQAINSPSLTFNGSNNYVQTQLDLTGGDEFTFFAFINPIEISTNDYIFDQSNGQSGLAIRFQSNLLEFFRYDTVNGLRLFRSQKSILLNQWTSVAGTISPTQMKIYINGVLDTSLTVQTTEISLDTSNMRIGLASDSNIGHYHGMMAVVCGFFSELTASQINDLHNSNFEVLGDAEFIYPFSEGQGTTVYDVSGNDHTGSLFGPNTWINTQNNLHWSLAKGFSQVGDVQVPALLDGSADAQGNPITNPAGPWHNGASTDIQLPEGVWSFNQIRNNPNFIRNNNGQGFADRFLSYDSILSGLDLQKTQDFINE